jgi:putative transposase
MVENTLDLQELVGKQLEEAEPDVLREIMRNAVGLLMSAEADSTCNAAYGERSEERTNSRNGYRARRWDTRVGTIDLKIPKLRTGTYFPDWLLEPRQRAEKAFIAVIADCYLAGVSTRRVDKLVKTLGIDGISSQQVSRLAKEFDAVVEAFRSRPLDGAPYAYGKQTAAAAVPLLSGTKPPWKWSTIFCWFLRAAAIESMSPVVVLWSLPFSRVWM